MSLTYLRGLEVAELKEEDMPVVWGFPKYIILTSKLLDVVKNINLVLATLYSIILVLVETILNTYWNDWQYAPLWIVDYLIALILLSAVFVFKQQLQNLILLLGWSFSAGVTYMALFISLDPNGLNSEDIEGKLPLFVLALLVSIIGLVSTIIDFKQKTYT